MKIRDCCYLAGYVAVWVILWVIYGRPKTQPDGDIGCEFGSTWLLDEWYESIGGLLPAERMN